MEEYTVIIDGVKVTAPKGTTILEAARMAGINIPTLCYLKDIKGIKTKEQLTEEERAKCVDVSQIVGTERW